MKCCEYSPWSFIFTVAWHQLMAVTEYYVLNYLEKPEEK